MLCFQTVILMYLNDDLEVIRSNFDIFPSMMYSVCTLKTLRNLPQYIPNIIQGCLQYSEMFAWPFEFVITIWHFLAACLLNFLHMYMCYQKIFVPINIM